MGQESIWPLVAAAAASALGYFWYHPSTFGTLWMRLSGMTPEMAEHGSKHRHLYAGVSFAVTLVIAFMMRMFMQSLTVLDVGSAAQLGFLLWFGFTAPMLLGSVLWEHRPFGLYLVNACYWLLALVLMAAILAV